MLSLSGRSEPIEDFLGNWISSASKNLSRGNWISSSSHGLSTGADLISNLLNAYSRTALASYRDKEGRSGTLLTAKNGSLGLLKLWLDYITPDDDLNGIYSKDFQGKCIAHYAAEAGSREILDYLAVRYPELIFHRDRQDKDIVNYWTKNKADSNTSSDDYPIKLQQTAYAQLIDSYVKNIHQDSGQGWSRDLLIVSTKNQIPGAIKVYEDAMQGLCFLYKTRFLDSKRAIVKKSPDLSELFLLSKDNVPSAKETLLKCLREPSVLIDYSPELIFHIAQAESSAAMQSVLENYKGILEQSDYQRTTLLHDATRSGSIDLINTITNFWREKMPTLADTYFRKRDYQGRNIIHFAHSVDQLIF
ncbi:MAG: hypothetical protein ACHQ1D_03715 [Nitrososphaerales archaeon]